MAANEIRRSARLAAARSYGITPDFIEKCADQFQMDHECSDADRAAFVVEMTEAARKNFLLMA